MISSSTVIWLSRSLALQRRLYTGSGGIMDLVLELVFSFLSYGAVGLLGGLVAVWLWCRRPPGEQLFPPQRQRAVSWGTWEVLMCYFLMRGLPVVVALLFKSWQRWLSDEWALSLGAGLADPFLVFAIPLLLYRLKETLPYQLGLTTSRLRSNLVLGVLGFLLLAPAVYLIEGVTEEIYRLTLGKRPEEHPILKLLEGEFPILGWTMLWYTGVLVAPVLEELFFRGVLFRWLLVRPVASHCVVLFAFVESMGTDKDGIPRARFVLLLVVPYLVIPRLLAYGTRWRGSPIAEEDSVEPVSAGDAEASEPLDPVQQLARAVRQAHAEPLTRTFWAMTASSALFAALHPWPTPVPLVVLAMGLCWLAYRTQSLVAPVVLHMLFNSVACLTEWQKLLFTGE
jgi:membrane protease YdiL (CAAX protease family)